MDVRFEFKERAGYCCFGWDFVTGDFFMRYPKTSAEHGSNVDSVPLNKYLSVAGICSRRDAVEFIRAGHVQVNGVVVQEPGQRVVFGDKVTFKGRPVIGQKKVYVLLNKPKDYIATVQDEKERSTVLDLLGEAVPERVYPVGRLDRFTTGLILITNDGELSQKLSHPKFGVSKVYTVFLDQPLRGQDLVKIKNGVHLKDGFVAPDRINYILGKNKKYVKIGLHSGKNRIVRRIFKSLGYNVVRLDRINYAGLSKGGLLPGRWRFLNKEEVELLKKYGHVAKKRQ